MVTRTSEPRRDTVLEAVNGLSTAPTLPQHRVLLLAPVAPRRKPPSGTLRAIVVPKLAWPCSCSYLVCLNARCPYATFNIKNGCLNVPSTPCPRASKWSLHWPAGPRRSHREPPYRHSHRPPPTAKTPNWHRSLEFTPGVSRPPAQEAFRFGILRPWSSAPCIWDSGDAGVLRGGVGRDFS